MTSKNLTKEQSNSFSTGGGGSNFESHIQASFVTLMLTGGYAPCLPCWPIKKIKLQGKVDGFDTDDLIVFVEQSNGKESSKLIGQIKHSISLTKNSALFAEVIQAAWNDFNNSNVFTQKKDVIVLITGALSSTDNNVAWLCHHARANSCEDFFRNVKTAKFSSKVKQEKLQAIEHHLKSANSHQINETEVYNFLRHFYVLGYDLGEEEGVILSLINSHIAQFHPPEPRNIWSRILEVTQNRNHHAGSITQDDLPSDLIEIFKQPSTIQIPKSLTKSQREIKETDWNQHKYAADLALINLIGGWDDKNEYDINVLSSLLDQDYSSWEVNAREILHLPDTPLSLKNGQWEITKRTELWDLLGSRIFDRHLDKFKEIAVNVLTEKDPALELPQEKRFMASVYGKTLKHSQLLRISLVNGLAMLGNKSSVLINCSNRKAKNIAIQAASEVFSHIEWDSWASLKDLLPALSEAAPNDFLETIDGALQVTPSPFKELLLKEGDGVGGYHYLSGILWALEGLAWDDKYIVRACILLAELSYQSLDNKKENRAFESLSHILLPWLHQTTASIEKRKVVVKTVCEEFPEIGWKLLINLLPDNNGISSYTHKPILRNVISEYWEKNVTPTEYWEQISSYTELAIKIAENDIDKLSELIKYLDDLPEVSFHNLLGALKSDAILSLPESEKLNLWETLIRFITRHRRLDSKGGLSRELLSSIEEVADKLVPSEPFNLYQYLFTGFDFDLYENNSSIQEQERQFDKRRQDAISELLDQGRVELVIEFANTVKSPMQVGSALGTINNINHDDAALLRAHLKSENQSLYTFITSYVTGRYNSKGWEWVDSLDKTDWTQEQICHFLCCLPFGYETWERVEKWLKDKQDIYWSQVYVNPYQARKYLEDAINKLLQYKRPYAAIDCLYELYVTKQEINLKQCIKALTSALSSKEPSHLLEIHHVVELIKILQESSEVEAKDMFTIEVNYLNLLINQEHYGVSPKFLESSIANDPEFFCTLIQMVYHSEEAREKQTKQFSNEEKNIAENVWSLLHRWKTPPGMQKDGNFSSSQFSSWLEKVKEICTESGHLGVALSKIGNVLIYTPPDENGLWINSTVADALNKRNVEDMRNGYAVGIFNSRGVHYVDPTGKPEFELAEKYKEQAEAVENAGYHRFAVTMKNLAETYLQEAKNPREYYG
ncbi:MAG: hypothetical protein VSS52_007120 [Thiotrichaceae bacterium]|nr:hypothetical protein [Thiotrichaceae bacterium]